MTNDSANDENLDVLQNIEFAIVSTLEDYPDMDDSDAMAALDALIKDLRDLERDRTPKPHTFSGAPQRVFNRVQEICSWRMGSGPAPGSDSEGADDVPEPPILPAATLSRCLKKIRKSMDHWHGVGGRRGYLEFIIRYFPE